MGCATLLLLMTLVCSADDAVSGPSEPVVQASEPAQAAVPADLAAIVKKQFGDGFEIALKKSAGTGFKYRIEKKEVWTPFLTADLDGDGIEDAVIVARSKTPMRDEAEFNYKVIDPFFTAYGYGDPKVTGTMTGEDPDSHALLLVIHGAGAEAWRAATPKAKFVVINLPIENISAHKQMFKKRLVAAIDPGSAESNGAMMLWDGKKYRWVEANGK